jgi:very-short-patch-repair endonuclease
MMPLTARLERRRGTLLGLVVEVDGGVHVGRELDDAERDRLLRGFGYRVVRVSAELVERDLAAAVAIVRAALGP